MWTYSCLCIYSLLAFFKLATFTYFQGAFWGMVIGFIIGAIRMILDFTYLDPGCGKLDNRPSIIAKVHYMYFALILFWLTALAIVVISLLTKPLKEGNVSRFMLSVAKGSKMKDS